MSQRLNKLFNTGDSLSREEAASYFGKSLPKEEKHAIEEKMASDPFSDEAMEGLESDPSAITELDVLQQQWNAGYSSSPATTMYKSLFWFSSAVAVVACIAIVYLLSQNETPSKNENPVIAGNNTSSETKNEPVSEEIIITEIENAQPIDKNEQITYEKTVRQQPKTVIEVTSEVNPVVIPETQPEPVDPKTVNEIKTPEPENTVVKSNVKFTYLHDLKVVDYSEIYTSSIKKTEVILTGVSADKEDASSKTETEIRTVLVPYEDYLEETLEEFTRNNYKNALKNFRIIHEHYPEDLNAFFYSGLCYYNLGKFDKAMECFDKCINNSFSTFEEEAEWNKALCLLKKKKYDEAEELLVKIITRRGHYSRMASEKIKEIPESR